MVATEIAPFVEATTDVLYVMTSMLVQVQSIGETNDQSPHADYTGIMGLAGESRSMALTLSFPRGTIIRVAARMMDERDDEAEASAPSVLGELLNMISGQARATLSAEGFELEATLPTVVRGSDLALIPSDAQPITTVEFDSAAGTFRLTLAVDRPLD